MVKKHQMTFLCVSFCFVCLFACQTFAQNVTSQVKTSKTIGIKNDFMQISFDKKTGAIVSLKNLATDDEYLKREVSSGNPFRIYLNPSEMPPEVTCSFPWNAPAIKDSDTFGGKLVEAINCKLVKSSFERGAGAGILKLKITDSASSLGFELQVRLADFDDGADVSLTVNNKSRKAQKMMTAFPYLTGVGLGETPETNLSVKMGAHGTPGEPAWKDSGGVYGRRVIMQWHSIYEPSLNEGLGVIVMDSDLQNKIIRRFAPSGLSVIYFPISELKAGDSVTYPAVRFMVHEGNWRKVAKRYGSWIRDTFDLRMPPQWYNEVDMFSGWWIPDANAVAESKERLKTGATGPMKEPLFTDVPIEYPAVSPTGKRPEYFTSFEELPKLYLGHTRDLVEWAMYHQGMVNVRSRGQDGTYHFRSDLGGAIAMREGVKRAHDIGRKVMFYVASISARNDSDIFRGTEMTDWMCMEAPGKMLNIGYPQGVSMCFGYEPWKNHIAGVCRRLIEETGADGVRLDEFGTAYIRCFNPVHKHESPYNGIKWSLEFLRAVRAAMDEVNPDTILMTEGSTDFMHIYSDAGGLQMWDCGREIEAIRVALPSYRGPAYHHGSVETALNGWAANREFACRTWLPKSSSSNWIPSRPESYPLDGGPVLRWEDLRSTFRDAQSLGTVTDSDPYAPDDPAWVGRLWMADDYWVMIGGHEDASLLAGPTKVKLPELPATVRCAYEIDTISLEIKPLELSRNSDGIFVTTTSGFGAVLLPTPQCRPLVLIDSRLPTLKVGGEMKVAVKAFAPWGERIKPEVDIKVPGLQVDSEQLTLPGEFTIKAADGTLPGKYYIKVTGDCLPLKRWIEVVK